MELISLIADCSLKPASRNCSNRSITNSLSSLARSPVPIPSDRIITVSPLSKFIKENVSPDTISPSFDSLAIPVTVWNFVSSTKLTLWYSFAIIFLLSTDGTIFFPYTLESKSAASLVVTQRPFFVLIDKYSCFLLFRFSITDIFFTSSWYAFKNFFTTSSFSSLSSTVSFSDFEKSSIMDATSLSCPAIATLLSAIRLLQFILIAATAIPRFVSFTNWSKWIQRSWNSLGKSPAWTYPCAFAASSTAPAVCCVL